MELPSEGASAPIGAELVFAEAEAAAVPRSPFARRATLRARSVEIHAERKLSGAGRPDYHSSSRFEPPLALTTF